MDANGETPPNDTCAIGALPDELLSGVMALIPCVTLVGACALVCKRWRAVALDDRAIGRKPCAVRVHWGDWGVRHEETAYRVPSTCDRAAAMGHLDCFEHGLDAKSACDYLTCSVAAPMGHVTILRRLFCMGFRCVDKLSAYRAACNGHLDVVRFLCTELPGLLNDTLMAGALEGESIDVIEYLLSRGMALDEKTCLTAARCGRMRLLCFVRAKGCAWNASVCHEAALHGRVDCLAYAHQSGLSISGCDWCAAICAGHEDVVRYACQNGWVPTAKHMMAAISNGRSGIVLCLRDHGYPWDAGVCYMIARSGQLGILRTVRLEHDCPWDERTCEAAAASRRDDILQFAHKNGCPWDLSDLAGIASRGGSVWWYLERHARCGDGRRCALLTAAAAKEGVAACTAL